MIAELCAHATLAGMTVPRCYPSSLPDAAWAVLEPLMPARDLRKGGTPRKYADRLALDAIFFVLRSGCQWRMIPRDLLPWDAAYRWYRTLSGSNTGMWL